MSLTTTSPVVSSFIPPWNMASKISLWAASTSRWVGNRLLSTISTTSLCDSQLKKRVRLEAKSTLARRSQAGPAGRGRSTSIMLSSPSSPEVCRLSEREGSLSASPSSLATLPARLRSSESASAPSRCASWLPTSSISAESTVYPLSSLSRPLISSSSALSLPSLPPSSSLRCFGRCPPTRSMLPRSSQAAWPPRAIGLLPMKSGCVQVSVSNENM
mmetsp:Transcript_36180/g.91318  ORF Transcript_36180/g.91318 Transcript_36180/m.91318 type:complete len:216 (-) Transcript_36180:1167-1814(-)